MKSSKVPGKDYVVVDVRDEDFVGGNIRGCLHIPSQKYEELFNELYTKVKDIPTVIFHCAYSQARSVSLQLRLAIVHEETHWQKRTKSSQRMFLFPVSKVTKQTDLDIYAGTNVHKQRGQ